MSRLLLNYNLSLLKMFSIQSLILIIFLIKKSSTATNTPTTTTIKCDDYKNLENNMLKVVGSIIDKRYAYPTKDEEFNKYCKNIKNGVKFTKDYSQQCMQNNVSGKSILTIASYSITQTTKKFCSRRNPKIRQELIDIANCVNPNRKLLIQCMETYIDRLNLTINVQLEKNKFPYMCCVTDLFATCMNEKLSDSKLSSCAEDVITKFQQFYGGALNNVMNFACENFEDQQDRCKTMVDKETKLVGKLTRLNQWRTPFPILIEFFKTL